MLVGVFFFIAGEDTAIATVPAAEDVTVFAPLTPTPLPTLVPTPTSAPVGNTWNAGVAALLINRCGTCHAASVFGGFDISSYESITNGGNSGPAFIAGDTESSLIVQRQLTGDHPGQLSEEELSKIIDWINAGAAEQ